MQRDIAKSAWDTSRFGMICETAGAFADMKTDIEQLCQIAGPNCTVEVQQQVTEFFSRIEQTIKKPLPASKKVLIFRAGLGGLTKPL